MIDSHSSLAEKFIKKGFWLILLSFIIWPLGYIIKIIISQELSVEEVWILYGIISLVVILIGYNDFWITESLKYFIPRYYEEKRYDKIKSILLIGFLIQFSTSILLMCLFFFGAEMLWNSYFHNPIAIKSLKIFSLFFIGINIFQLINTFFLAIQNTFLYRFSELIRIIFVLLWTVIIFVWGKWNIETYSYAWIIGLYFWIIFTLVIFYLRYYKKYFQGEKIISDIKFIKEVLGYAILVLLWSQASTILSQIDMQMIIYFLWAKEAWYYTNYLSIIGIFFILIWPLFTFLLPVFSELWAKKQKTQLTSLKSELTHAFLFFWICYSIFVFVFWESIAFILFWEKFLYSWEILKYSVPFLVCNFLLQINFNLLAWLGRVKERIRIISYAIISNIILNFILLHMLWVWGAALATWFWWILILFLSEKTLGKEYSVHINVTTLFWNISIFSVLGYFGYLWGNTLLHSISRFADLWVLVCILFIWTLVYIAINKSFFLNLLHTIKNIRYAQRRST